MSSKIPVHLREHEFQWFASKEGFSEAEILWIEKYGSWFLALMHGSIKSDTWRQRRFVCMANRLLRPIYKSEKRWRKYQNACCRSALARVVLPSSCNPDFELTSIKTLIQAYQIMGSESDAIQILNEFFDINKNLTERDLRSKLSDLAKSTLAEFSKTERLIDLAKIAQKDFPLKPWNSSRDFSDAPDGKKPVYLNPQRDWGDSFDDLGPEYFEDDTPDPVVIDQDYLDAHGLDW